MVTFAFLKESVRRLLKTNLGFMPDYDDASSAEMKTMKPDDTLRDYHAQLDVMILSFPLDLMV